MAKAEVEAERIKTLYRIETAALTKRAVARFLGEETQRQLNLENILRLALPGISEKAKTENVDQDWITNFIDKAKLTSDVELQRLWSRILTAEGNAPGSVSKRTVNALASFDKKDAELFARLCNYLWVIGDPIPLILDSQADIYKNSGVNFTTLTHLDAIGLITFDGIAHFSRLHLPKKFAVQYQRQLFGVECPQDQYDLDIGNAMLTLVGQEIARIHKPEPIQGFTDYVLEYWRKQGIIITDPSAPKTPTVQLKASGSTPTTSSQSPTAKPHASSVETPPTPTSSTSAPEVSAPFPTPPQE